MAASNVGLFSSAVVTPHVAVLYSPPEEGLPGSHMTLVVGICAHDSIVLAADSRLTSNELGLVITADDEPKLFGLGGCGLGFAGYVGMTGEAQHYIDGARRGSNPGADDVDALSLRLGTGLFSAFSNRFPRLSPTLWPSGSIMLAGYEVDRATPRIFCFHSRQGYTREEPRPATIGSPLTQTLVSFLARTLLPRARRPTTEHAKLFAATAIGAAARSDPAVGGLLQMATITPTGGLSSLATDELVELQRRSAEAIERMAQAFFSVP